MLVMHVELTLTAGTKTKAPPVFSSKCMNTTGSSLLLFSLSYLSLSLCVDSLLRMKEETAEVDEFTFSQGTSDQESNGSGSYYIKQEP